MSYWMSWLESWFLLYCPLRKTSLAMLKDKDFQYPLTDSTFDLLRVLSCRMCTLPRWLGANFPFILPRTPKKPLNETSWIAFNTECDSETTATQQTNRLTWSMVSPNWKLSSASNSSPEMVRLSLIGRPRISAANSRETRSVTRKRPLLASWWTCNSNHQLGKTTRCDSLAHSNTYFLRTFLITTVVN